MSLEASPEAQAALNLFHRRELSQGADAPLVYMVHGRAGDAGVMWPFRRVLPSQANIVAPQAFLQDRVGGYSWWDIEAPAAQRKGDVLRAADTLSTFIEKSRQYYELQPPYLIACGFSQGGILLSALLQRMPTFFRCIALLASEVYQLDRVELLGDSAQWTEVLLVHGSQDDVIPLSRAEQSQRYLNDLGFNVTLHVDPVGHKVGAAGMRVLKQWFEGQLAGEL